VASRRGGRRPAGGRRCVGRQPVRVGFGASPVERHVGVCDFGAGVRRPGRHDRGDRYTCDHDGGGGAHHSGGRPHDHARRRPTLEHPRDFVVHRPGRDGRGCFSLQPLLDRGSRPGGGTYHPRHHPPVRPEPGAGVAGVDAARGPPQCPRHCGGGAGCPPAPLGQYRLRLGLGGGRGPPADPAVGGCRPSGRRAYRPDQMGGRFSMKACRPSRLSSLAKARPMAALDNRQPAASSSVMAE